MKAEKTNSLSLNLRRFKHKVDAPTVSLFDRKKKEEAWQKNEEKYRLLVENCLVGFYLLQDSIIKFCSDRLAKIFGYERYQDLLNKNIKELVEPHSWPLMQKQNHLLLSEEIAVAQYEFQGISRSGTIIDLEISATKILYQGKATIEGAIYDISHQKRAERTLHDGEIRFKILFESSPDGIFMVDAKGKILEANLAASLLYESGKSEIIGKNIKEMIGEAYQGQVADDIPRMLSGEISFYETSFNTNEGKTVPVELRIRSVSYAGQKMLMFYVRDISERVRVGENFLESQRSLSNFMSNLPGVAYRCLNDKAWTMKFISQGCQQLTGYRPYDLIDNKSIAFGDIIHPDYQKQVWHTIQKALKKHRAYQLEYKIITASNQELWVWEQGRGVYDEFGKLMSCEGIIIDVDNLKRAEEALRESEVRFRSLVENVPSIAVQGFDKNRKVIFWNKASEKLYGYEKEEALGQEIEQLIIPPYNRAEVMAEIAEWIKKGKTVPPGERSLMRKDGSIFEAHSSHVLLKNIRGESEFYSLDVDLTALNRVKKDLQKSLHNLKKTLDGIVLALMSAVEMRDPYTAGHQNGVAKLACAIAKELGLNEHSIEGLRIGSLLHDIGKLNIPSEILTKPGGLSDIEYKLMQTHPQFGFEILRSINFPWPIAQMVLQHHEKIDGSGYPQGLTGDKIMLEAKILTVADVVEPMSSHRPYRPALGMDAALAEIKKGRGIFYDAEVADCCINLIEKKGFHFGSSQ